MPAIHLRKPYRSPSILSRRNKLVKETKKQAVLVDIQRQADHEVVPTKAGDVTFDHGVAVMPNDERAQDAYDELKESDPLLPDRYAIVRNREGMYRDDLHRTLWGQWPEMPWKVSRNGAQE